MSYTKEITLWCNIPECNNWKTFSAGRILNARKEANINGWTYKNGKDICNERNKLFKKGN